MDDWNHTSDEPTRLYDVHGFDGFKWVFVETFNTRSEAESFAENSDVMYEYHDHRVRMVYASE